MFQNALNRLGEWALSRAHGEGVFVPKSLGGVQIPKSYPWNWWQKDLPVRADDFSSFGPVLACVTIIAQDLSRVPLKHVKVGRDGAEEEITHKTPAKLFREPNHYQTLVDFILYLMRSLLFDGNFYAYAPKNRQGKYTAFYPLHPRLVSVYLDPQGTDYYYRVGSDNTTTLANLDSSTWLMPSQVFHVRLFTPIHPLIGETPLVAADFPTQIGSSINRHSARFFQNMTRPSGVLRHPKRLGEDAKKAVKRRWMELFSGDNMGEPVVLSEGMDWRQIEMNAVDAELVKIYGLSERQIFQLYRVPAFLGGDLEKATLNNVESLIRFYVQSCLGFYVRHVETALTRFLGLPMNERIIFDLEKALLRGDFESRMGALGKAVQSGIFSPNEARKRENLKRVENGDEPRVQQQMVPLSFGAGTDPGLSSQTGEETRMPEKVVQRSLLDETQEYYEVLKNLTAT